jgi:hypothetical protein
LVNIPMYPQHNISKKKTCRNIRAKVINKTISGYEARVTS